MYRLVLFLLLLSPGVHGDSSLGLPEIGDSTGDIISPEYERRLGQAFLSQVRKQADIVTDPEVETYIMSIGYRLVAQSDSNTRPFTFFFINDPAINAFAAPGGIVGMNSGVIISSDNESELAGVVAHEIAHVTQKHMARAVEMQRKLSIPTLAATLGAILVAAMDPAAGQAALAAVQGGIAQARINFTRSNEEEADRVGVQLLARAEFNPKGMPAFFEKLQKNSRYSAKAPEFLRTHPLTNNRIADSLARAAAYPTDFKYQESRTYHYVKAKLIVKSYKNPDDAVTFYRDQIKNNYDQDRDVSTYGYAIALAASNQYKAARKQLRSLLQKEPENIVYLLAAADVEGKAGAYQDAVDIYEQAKKIYPGYRPLVLNYANLLLIAERPEQARDLLIEFGKSHTPDITYYNMLTRAEAEAGDQVESNIANAEYHFLTGETLVAIQQLKFALGQEDPGPDYYQQERMQARLEHLEQELAIERALNLAR
ncbi:MAG: M48 family metalloprotease [Gammaproteobacteria bacterium]